MYIASGTCESLRFSCQSLLAWHSSFAPSNRPTDSSLPREGETALKVWPFNLVLVAVDAFYLTMMI